MRKTNPLLKEVVLLGGGGHARVVIETAQKYCRQYRIIGITEEDRSLIGHEISGIPVMGDDSILPELYVKGLKYAFIAVGVTKNQELRNKLQKKITTIGFESINIIHGKSIRSEDIEIGTGNIIMAGCIINTGTSIGSNCIINTGSIIEHGCRIGDNVHIAPGAVLSGGVAVEENSMIGAGAVVIQNVTIGRNSIIGAGSTVILDIPPDSIAVGVPARVIKSNKT